MRKTDLRNMLRGQWMRSFKMSEDKVIYRIVGHMGAIGRI